MKKFFILTTIAIGILFCVQLSLIANGDSNNGGLGEIPFEWGRYTGKVRWVRDVRPNLKSNAYTGIFTRAEDPDNEDPRMQDELINWSASAKVEYTGDQASDNGTYTVQADILIYKQRKSGDWDEELDESVGFYIQMSPPPDNVTPDIEDCKANGSARITEGWFNRIVEQTFSHIPF